MLVKVEARILIFPGTDFHFPSTSVPPGTFFKALSKIQIGFTFLVPAHLGSPGKGPLNGCVCVCVLWLGPPLAALRYDMYFRFYGRGCNLHTVAGYR